MKTVDPERRGEIPCRRPSCRVVPAHTPRPATRADRAFTLIEILVVVAIIALLVAILIPALSRARTLSRVTICKANSKQIGTMIAEYTTENREYVPLMYNYWTNNPPYSKPARTCWLSVALRKYMPGHQNLKDKAGGQFNPDVAWSDVLRQKYEDTVLPEFFMCPFERGKGPHALNITNTDTCAYFNYTGRFESYHTWMWSVITRGTQLNRNGAPKVWRARYSVITWRDGDKYRRWTKADANQAKSAGLSDLTAVYCGQGEFTIFPDPADYDRRANVGSHSTTRGGGTNALFADTHVEWVSGQEIGRP